MEIMKWGMIRFSSRLNFVYTVFNTLETKWNSIESIPFYPHVLETKWNSTEKISSYYNTMQHLDAMLSL